MDTQNLTERSERIIPLRWYREVTIVLSFYGVYTLVRNQFGSASVLPARALGNAIHVIRAEEALDLFIEPRLQGAFLEWEGFLRFWNIFYGSLHFIVTAGVMVWLYRRHPQRYRRWRTILGGTVALALFGFGLFPLMPPRLLADLGQFGGGTAQFPFVDTLAEVGGLWSFGSEGMKSITNQYAAMPSLHIAWSTWCALAIIPVAQSWWTRTLFALYPFITLFAVMVTANHYWLDGVGGLIALAGGYVACRMIEQQLSIRTSRELLADRLRAE